MGCHSTGLASVACVIGDRLALPGPQWSRSVAGERLCKIRGADWLVVVLLILPVLWSARALPATRQLSESARGAQRAQRLPCPPHPPPSGGPSGRHRSVLTSPRFLRYHRRLWDSLMQ